MDRADSIGDPDEQAHPVVNVLDQACQSSRKSKALVQTSLRFLFKYQSFSSTLRTLSSIVRSLSIRFPNRMRSMQAFMALLHCGKDLVPIALDISTVRGHVCVEPCCCEDTFTDCDFLQNRDSDADRNDAQISNNFHSSIVITGRLRGRVTRSGPCLEFRPSDEKPTLRVESGQLLRTPFGENGIARLRSQARYPRYTENRSYKLK